MEQQEWGFDASVTPTSESDIETAPPDAGVDLPDGGAFLSHEGVDLPDEAAYLPDGGADLPAVDVAGGTTTQDEGPGAEGDPGFEPTGVPDVDAALELLGQLDGSPPSAHVDVYEDTHRRLHEALLAAGEDNRERGPGPS
ncbi:hypothetical protein [Actinopolymorpha alba]|uniref:hypothetical protein n=1 Tax=Actinopolymorpha alba TaxID=533267 RepID=UPI000361D429|nr:hypothetical protein [Actinopolymorpha alba]